MRVGLPTVSHPYVEKVRAQNAREWGPRLVGVHNTFVPEFCTPGLSAADFRLHCIVPIVTVSSCGKPA